MNVDESFQVTFENWVKNQANRKNSKSLSDDVYNEIVQTLKGNTHKQYNEIKRRIKRNGYRIMDFPRFSLKDVLCTPLKDEDVPFNKSSIFNGFRRVARISEVFGIIHEAHIGETNHAGEKKTLHKIRESVSNITMDIVKYYISNCKTCALKAPQYLAAPLKPIVSNHFMDRMQIDLIDMTQDPDESFKYIGHICDHFAKYHVLFALKTKEPKEVAWNIKRFYLSYFGLPKIIQSDNGAEFVDVLIKGLVALWPGRAQIINGSPRHSQSQGLVEQSNCTIEKMISARRIDEGENTWEKWLPEFQYSLNTNLSSSLKKTPFDVVYGQKPNCLHALGIDFEPVNQDEIPEIFEDIQTQTSERQNIGVQHNESQEGEEDLVNFNIHHTNTEVTENDSFRVSCPLREIIRKKASENLSHSRKVMVTKYQKKKGKRLSSFEIEEHVSVEIPKKNRKKANVKRLPCIVIDKVPGIQEQYKLMCEHGVLKGSFNASSLMPYPGKVRGNAESKLTLQAASSMLLGKESVSCNCKGSCSSNICLCFVNSVPCSSKCHKGENKSCKNKQNTNDNNIILPRYGGKYGVNNTVFSFINTCPLDTWFTIFRYLDINELRRAKFCSDIFSKLMELIFSHDYEGARILVADINNIQPNLDCISFYGSEFDLIIKPFLLPYFENFVTAACDGLSCPDPHRMICSNDCPAVCGDNVSDVNFEEAVCRWFTSDQISICGLGFTDDSTPEEHKFPDVNTETGEISYYCNGDRTIHKRVLLNPPYLLPINVESVGLPSTFPSRFTVTADDSHTYAFNLHAISLCNMSHYTSIIKLNDEWLYYDGKKSHVKRSKKQEFPVDFRPTCCLYVLGDVTANNSDDYEMTVQNNKDVPYVDICEDMDVGGEDTDVEALNTSFSLAKNLEHTSIAHGKSITLEEFAGSLENAQASKTCLSNSVILKSFAEMDAIERERLILSWFASDETVDDVLGLNCYLTKDLILVKSHKKLPNSLQSDIDFLSTYCSKEGENIIRGLVANKKRENIWKCPKCYNKIVSRSIICERCLQWYHISCSKVLRKPAGDWFCQRCKDWVEEQKKIQELTENKAKEFEMAIRKEQEVRDMIQKFIRENDDDLKKMLIDSEDLNVNPHLRLVGKSGAYAIFDELNKTKDINIFFNDDVTEVKELLVIPLKRKYPELGFIDSKSMARMDFLLNEIPKLMKKYKYIP